ncbi:hypothetical protein D3C87_2204740 [compost metagenome]
MRSAEGIEVQTTLDFRALDGGVLDVGALEGRLVIARGDSVFINEVAVLVVKHRHLE